MTSAIDFLMAGDPAIRWQTMRDLLDAPTAEWEAERAKVACEDWGAKFLAAQLENGEWPNARWTGTVWTMVQLVDFGMPVGPRFEPAFEAIVGRVMPRGKPVSVDHLFKNMDICHLGFWLKIGAHFLPGDERLPALAEAIASFQMADGGFNCRIRTEKNVTHSSFHTTFNVLEGLRPAAVAGIIDPKRFAEVEKGAVEFMLQHKLYRSDKTGEIVHPRFTELTFPNYWHYTYLRALDYIRLTPYIGDPRLADPIARLESRRKPNSIWALDKRIPGVTIFNMESVGRDSRWNTLMALRVLRAQQSQTANA